MGMATDSRFHVLVVDDSLIDKKLIEKLLKTSSYQVTTVDSGSKALEFLGLRNNDQIDPSTPSVSPSNLQVSYFRLRFPGPVSVFTAPLG
ncbi:hypothetical protein QN277_010296 [Acacia crassicarpa]|uniref:Response regulatory domain-containing protein n=1 Tax=Acacia crassicarpa TaxID=499986 RepID=A0AAE1IQN5_9FABA|nr:hypothetical protein QN277_010296 [Acacia crassicarpa]